MPHGCAEKIRVIIAFAALIRGLGLDLSRHPFRHRNDPAVSHGRRRAFVLAGSHHVCDRVVAGRIGKSSLGELAHVADHRSVFAARGNGGVTISEQYIDSGLAALIVAIVPIYIVHAGLGDGNGAQADTDRLAWAWLAVLLGLAFCSDQLCVFHSIGGRHPAIGMSILLVSSFHLVGRIALLAQLRNTQPLHFSLPLNKCSAADCCFCSRAS